MKYLAVMMRYELEQGDVDAFARLLNEHWERIIIFLCLFPYLEPVVITGTLDIIFNIGKIVSVVYCITTLMAKRKTRKYCKYIKYIVFFYLSYVLNTAINGGQWEE